MTQNPKLSRCEVERWKPVVVLWNERGHSEEEILRVLREAESLNTKLALAGGVLAGVGASACCVGPLLLLSLGIGSAWIAHLTAQEP